MEAESLTEKKKNISKLCLGRHGDYEGGGEKAKSCRIEVRRWDQRQNKWRDKRHKREKSSERGMKRGVRSREKEREG